MGFGMGSSSAWKALAAGTLTTPISKASMMIRCVRMWLLLIRTMGIRHEEARADDRGIGILPVSAARKAREWERPRWSATERIGIRTRARNSRMAVLLAWTRPVSVPDPA